MLFALLGAMERTGDVRVFISDVIDVTHALQYLVCTVNLFLSMVCTCTKIIRQ
jgi:hypothetical protein